MTEGRRHDPRRLSRRKAGRSEIQDEPLSIPPSRPENDGRETVGKYRRTAGIRPPPPEPETLKKRALRRRGAMPPGSDE
jgi:hypothetical protein